MAAQHEQMGLGMKLGAAFGQRLREVRGNCGLSQNQLARRAKMRPSAIGRLERGARAPALETILRLARGLGVPPGTLLDELVALLDPSETD